MDNDKIFSEQADNSSSKSTLEGLISFIEILWKNRKQIVKTVFIVAVLAAGVSLILPKTYTATTTVLPDIDFLVSLQEKLGGLQDIAAAAGLVGGNTSPSALYPDIMQSETVLRNVIYHQYKTESYDSLVNLIQYWGYDDDDQNLNFERCVERMRKRVTSISVDRKTLIITMTVETGERQLSADIANQITSELDYFQRNFRRTNASEQRKFLQQRMIEVKKDLATSEDKLKEFREKNRRVEQSPQLLLEQDRLGRDVELNTAIFIELKKQYELAKLDEIKNTPIVQVLDTARPPAKKSSPKRTLIVIISAFLFFIGSTGWYIAKERFQKKEGTKDKIEHLSKLFNIILNDIKVKPFSRGKK